MKKLLAILLLFTWTPAFAGVTETTFLSASEVSKNASTVKRIEKYLTNITTLIADFTQVAPNGALATGKFYMSRPGKMRWQYNPPTPILMVSNGSEFVYYDYELQQVSYVPLDSTLLGFLAKDVISFSGKEVGITSFEKAPGVIRIELAQREKPTDGKLMLEFSDAPLVLKNFIVTDASNQTTRVALNNALFGTAIDPKQFIFRDPRKRRI